MSYSVGAATPGESVAPRSSIQSRRMGEKLPPREVGIWLLFMALAIWIMVVIGGTTRLTGSGLSITEWRPIMGAIPPLTDQHWQEAFDKYQATPQFKLMNSDMQLGGFKVIFFWEYVHRLWGRLLGFFFALPLLYFALAKKLSGIWLAKLAAALVLGGAQGLLGWVMVKSGLVDQPWVSPYRLTAHLLAALALFSYTLWMACDILLARPADSKPEWLRRGVGGLLVLLGLQIAWGGFLAGGKFALSYPTFPDMNGRFLPPALQNYQGFWHYLCDNPATVQFIHRGLGVLLVAGIVGFWLVTIRFRWNGILGLARHALLGLVVVQFLLGVAALVNSLGRVPVVLGVSHQANAVLLLSAMLVLIHQFRQPLSDRP